MSYFIFSILISKRQSAFYDDEDDDDSTLLSDSEADSSDQLALPDDGGMDDSYGNSHDSEWDTISTFSQAEQEHEALILDLIDEQSDMPEIPLLNEDQTINSASDQLSSAEANPFLPSEKPALGASLSPHLK
ncbi:unnamed protein product [Protopolystoma xenopodis]|uniref:Uncharacterized protein n=1 Tax=Protopolystoma xenopodis TaxID=117903 RepID=A0A3S5ARQ8_9PLAT|nr:unnamed protein product [Protopolystoma xenopodis]